jgi:hypothetical protein
MRYLDGGYGWLAHLAGAIVYGIFALLSLAIVVALVFFFVRFLLIGTRAAQLYIDLNGPPKPAKSGPRASAPAPTRAPAPAPAPAPPADAGVKTTPGITTTSAAAPPSESTPPASQPAGAQLFGAPSPQAETPVSSAPVSSARIESPSVPDRPSAADLLPRATPPLTPTDAPAPPAAEGTPDTASSPSGPIAAAPKLSRTKAATKATGADSRPSAAKPSASAVTPAEASTGPSATPPAGAAADGATPPAAAAPRASTPKRPTPPRTTRPKSTPPAV